MGKEEENYSRDNLLLILFFILFSESPLIRNDSDAVLSKERKSLLDRCWGTEYEVEVAGEVGTYILG